MSLSVNIEGGQLLMIATVCIEYKKSRIVTKYKLPNPKNNYNDDEIPTTSEQGQLQKQLSGKSSVDLKYTDWYDWEKWYPNV